MHEKTPDRAHEYTPHVSDGVNNNRQLQDGETEHDWELILSLTTDIFSPFSTPNWK